MNPRRRLVASLAAAPILASASSVLRAQSGAAPIRILVGFPAGGTIDVVARILAERLSHPPSPKTQTYWRYQCQKWQPLFHW